MKRLEIDTVRDAAIILEEYDLYKARELMDIAAFYRPEGEFIRKKLSFYEDGINKLYDVGLRVLEHLKNKKIKKLIKQRKMNE